MCGAVAATPAVRVLERARVAHTLHPYDPEHPSDQGHGEAAVAALGADPRQVFKTLVARVDGTLTVAVVPVSGTLDLKALAAAVGGRKAVMAEPADAERATGYVVGGISPLGQRKALPEFDIAWQVADGEELDAFVGDAEVLTDDHAPVDQLLTPYGS